MNDLVLTGLLALILTAIPGIAFTTILASPDKRLDRRRYFNRVTMLLLVCAGLALAFWQIHQNLGFAQTGEAQDREQLAAALAWSAVTVFLFPALATCGLIGLTFFTVWRLNDCGMPKWWALSLIPLPAGLVLIAGLFTRPSRS